MVARLFTQYRLVLDLKGEQMSAFIDLVEEMKKAYGRSIVNFSEIKSELPTMKRAYLQINFAKFTDLVQFYGGSSHCPSAVVSSFFTRIMEFYRSSRVCCKEMRNLLLSPYASCIELRRWEPRKWRVPP